MEVTQAMARHFIVHCTSMKVEYHIVFFEVYRFVSIFKTKKERNNAEDSRSLISFMCHYRKTKTTQGNTQGHTVRQTFFPAWNVNNCLRNAAIIANFYGKKTQIEATFLFYFRILLFRFCHK